MKSAENLGKLTILGLRDRYLKTETTPEEVVREIIERVAADAEMNIWITPPSLNSVKPYLDQLNHLDPARTPLWGIPFALKDNMDLAGTATTAGCPGYAYRPTEHAGVVERLVAAGAIPLGKTNMDQFATGLVGTRSPYGETHNALRSELISGGSSSGSAVAVARGHAAFALGTDTAGSGRVPAALNRLIGYKPSLGAWPTTGVVPACASLDCVTVFTHSLEDALEVDAIVRGVHEEDPWSRDIPHPSPKLPAKIFLPAEVLDFYGPYAEEYKAAWQVAVERLRKLPIPVEYVDVQMFWQAAELLYEGPWVAERWASLGGFVDAQPTQVFPVTEQILRTGAAEAYDAASVFHAIHQLQAFKLGARKRLQDAVLVMPTTGGTWTREQVRADPLRTNRDLGRYTNHCNLLDLCAVAVPSDDAAANTPFGITLFGLSEDEDLVFGTAGQFLHVFVQALEEVSSTTQVDIRTDNGKVTAEGDRSANPLLRPVQPAQAVQAQAQTTLVAVCGLHMRGYPLEKEILACGAHFVRDDVSAPKYQLVRLPTTPTKPGLIKRPTNGGSIQLEIWEMPLALFGSFVASVPAPLGMGKVELQDGSEVPGFLCEAYVASEAEDITAFGGWRNRETQE